MTTTLALDPATLCGFAVGSDGKVVDSGVWNLMPEKDVRPGQRGVRLFEYLDSIWKEHEPQMCFYEDVKFSATTYAAHLYGGLKMIIQVWCETHHVRYDGIHTAMVKKIATGKGNAKKEDMIAFAKLRWPDIQIVSHDHADALFVLEAGYELKRLKNGQEER